MTGSQPYGSVPLIAVTRIPSSESVSATLVGATRSEPLTAARFQRFRSVRPMRLAMRDVAPLSGKTAIGPEEADR